MEIDHRTTALNYFKYQTIGFILLCVKTDVKGLKPIDIINNLFTTFFYIFFISIWVGLANMFMIDLYIYLKKNGKNEWNNFCVLYLKKFYG